MIKKLKYSLLIIVPTLFYAITVTQTTHTFDISQYQTIHTTINNQEITLATASTPKLQTQGFMYVTEIPENQGMLFSYTEAQPRSFWMKNTNVPLDIIFLDTNNKIINIHHNVQPCKQIDPSQTNCPSYKSTSPSQKVIELPSPQAKLLNLKPNQEIKLSPTTN
jgi:uncharacterized membrane protein (UPF0127 family)